MGLLGKVVAVKAVKGRKEGKEEKKEEAAKTEEKKWKHSGKPGLYPGQLTHFYLTRRSNSRPDCDARFFNNQVGKYGQ